MIEFHATQTWRPTRPHMLVVCCSDGRFHPHVTEFVRVEVSRTSDLYAVPGGPACVDPWASSFDESRCFDQAMALFDAYHELEAVWLVAHRGCAYYALRHPGLDAEGLRAKQLEDLSRARARLRERYPKYALRCIWTEIDGEHVSFLEIDPEGRQAMHGS